MADIVGWLVGILWIVVCAYMMGVLLHGSTLWLAVICFLAWVPVTWPSGKERQERKK